MVPFASYVSRGQSKPQLIFSRINGPNVTKAFFTPGTQELVSGYWHKKLVFTLCIPDV